MSLTTGDEGGTLLLTTFDVVHDSVVLGLRDLRTLVGGGSEGVTNSELGGGGLELLNKLVVDALLDVDSGSSATSLTVVEAGKCQRVASMSKIGVTYKIPWHA